MLILVLGGIFGVISYSLQTVMYRTSYTPLAFGLGMLYIFFLLITALFVGAAVIGFVALAYNSFKIDKNTENNKIP